MSTIIDITYRIIDHRDGERWTQRWMRHVKDAVIITIVGWALNPFGQSLIFGR